MEAIKEAIFHASRAGGCRIAARQDVASARIWTMVAQAESEKASNALARVMDRGWQAPAHR